jgi:hypothetical protein
MLDALGVLEGAEDPQRVRQDRGRAPAPGRLDLLGGDRQRVLVPAEVVQRDGLVGARRRVDRRDLGEALRGLLGDRQCLLVPFLGEQLLGKAVEPVARREGTITAFREATTGGCDDRARTRSGCKPTPIMNG